MTDLLKSQLESILIANEAFWDKISDSDAKVLVDANTFALETSKIRAKLVAAMECAGGIFQTNMQCLAQILSMRAQRSELEASHRELIMTMQGRIDSLVSVVESQQLTIEKLNRLSGLKGLWRKLLSREFSESISGSDDQMNENLDNCTSAIALLSSACAREVLSSPQHEYSKTVPRDAGKSLVVLLLDKINSIEMAIGDEINRLNQENESLRLKLGEKSFQLQVYISRDDETAKLIEEVKTRSQECEKYISKSKSRIASLKREKQDLSQQVSQLRAENASKASEQSQLQKQFSEALQVSAEWQQNCLHYQSLYRNAVQDQSAIQDAKKTPSSLNLATTLVAASGKVIDVASGPDVVQTNDAISEIGGNDSIGDLSLMSEIDIHYPAEETMTSKRTANPVRNPQPSQILASSQVCITPTPQLRTYSAVGSSKTTEIGSRSAAVSTGATIPLYEARTIVDNCASARRSVDLCLESTFVESDDDEVPPPPPPKPQLSEAMDKGNSRRNSAIKPYAPDKIFKPPEYKVVRMMTPTQSQKHHEATHGHSLLRDANNKENMHFNTGSVAIEIGGNSGQVQAKHRKKIGGVHE